VHDTEAQSRRPLIYIVPVYDPESEEHYYHVYSFLTALAQEVPLHVVVEHARGRPEFPGAAGVQATRLRRPAILRSLELVARLARLRMRGCRTFYVHYSYVGALAAVLVSKVLGGRVYYWNCICAKEFERPWSLRWDDLRHKLAAEWPLRLTLRSVQHLVTGTPSMAAYYERHYGVPATNTIVIPNEIELERFASPSPDEVQQLRDALGLPTGVPVVLFVHRLAERKGAHLIVPIAERVLARRPDTMFVVIGDGPYRGRLERQVAASGASSSIRLLGRIPNRAIVPYYAMADVFMMPSLEEGFPRVLLEAMATGVPFVAVDVGGVRDILSPQQQRCVVPARDCDAFAARLVDLLNDPQGRAALAAEGRQHVQRFAHTVVRALFLERICGIGEVAASSLSGSLAGPASERSKLFPR
jgi:glycosyltransferase involved in cell wall biosynthesis